MFAFSVLHHNRWGGMVEGIVLWLFLLCCHVFAEESKGLLNSSNWQDGWLLVHLTTHSAQCQCQWCVPFEEPTNRCACADTHTYVMFPWCVGLLNLAWKILFSVSLLRDWFPVESLVVIMAKCHWGVTTAHTSLASCLSFSGGKSTSLKRSLLNQYRH